MKIAYFYRVPLPSARADAVQVIQTCGAMALAGARVALHVEQAGIASTAGMLEWFGVGPSASSRAANLSIIPLGRHWSWPFLTLRTAGTFWKEEGGACLFLREVRPYVPGLMDRAKRAGFKSIFEAHNVSASLARERESREAGGGGKGRRWRTRRQLELAILRRADALVCTQKATLEELSPLLRQGTPSMVLGNGARIPPELERREKDIEILYCGSLKSWKGVDTLVAAMQSLHPWTVTIVGPGTDQDLARLKALALALGVRERVRILPPVSPAEVWDLYARARVGVIPLPAGGSVEARRFTSPLKLFEMLAAGLPIVASNLPSVAGYVENDREAVLVPPDDPQFLAHGIKRVLNEADLRRRLSQAARERAPSFTWDERGRRLVELAGSITGAGRAGVPERRGG